MKTLEDQLNSARTDVQRSVSQMPTPPWHTIRRRQQHRKTAMLLATGAVAGAVLVGTSQVLPGESHNLAEISPADSPPATSGLTAEEEAFEDSLVGDDSDGRVTEDGPDSDIRLPEPKAEDWVGLPGGLSVAAIAEDDGNLRIWTKSGAQEPTPAASTDIAFLPVPVNATQIAVLIPAWQFYAEQGIDIRPYDTSDQVSIRWFEGSDAVDTVPVDWSGDERFGVALVEARDASILDVEFVTD